MAVSVYQQGGYGTAPLFPDPILSPRDPTTSDRVNPTGQPYQVFQGWNNTLTDATFIYLGAGNWVTLTAITGTVAQLTSDSGIALPTAGNISIVGGPGIATSATGSTFTIALTGGGIAFDSIVPGAGTNPVVPSATGSLSMPSTANQIVTTGGLNSLTITLSTTLIAPGSVTATSTLTANLGNITAVNGNFVASTAGSGIVVPVTTASGAAPGPVVCNGRAGSTTFTGVSIAAANDLTLTITNSAITGASTRVLITMSGSTTGSAPSIKSITPSAGSLAIVVTNGTGATTTIANIIFDFLVLN